MYHEGCCFCPADRRFVAVGIQKSRKGRERAGDRYYSTAPWIDAEILPPPKTWGGGLPDDWIPSPTMGFDSETGRPTTWPIRLTKVHWAILIGGLSAGNYTLRSRTIDEKGHAQPMPRPFRKSGHSAIEQVALSVKA